jgi:hypothetical protein
MLEFVLTLAACLATALALIPLPGRTLPDEDRPSRVICTPKVIVLTDREAARLEARIRHAKRVG